jgi:ribonucleoside-diphosphate reductase alpha chain
MSRIGFLQKYKQRAVVRDADEKSVTSKIRNVNYLGRFEVFSITVDAPEHTYTTGSLCVANCGEVILRSGQLCNLSEAIVRSDDTLKSLKEKVRLATILGTMQATLTNFRYLRDHWKKNTEEEALLGVSLTGVMDNQLMSGSKGKTELSATLDELRKCTITVNKYWAKTLGINPAAAITTNKPSGTVSQLSDCASGLHPRYSEYYIRTVRADNHDPVTKLLKEAGVPHEPDVTKPDHTLVFSFPVKSPDGSITNDDVNALDQLDLWRTYQESWCEHKPSMTVYVREHQWMEVGAWVYKHFDIISGVTFLPSSDHCYAQAPYQDVDKKTFDALVARMPVSIDWQRLSQFETDDAGVNTREVACSGDACELVDLTKN